MRTIFMIFILTFFSTSISAKMNQSNKDSVKVYGGIGLTTNFIIPENNYYFEHTPKFGGIGYTLEAGIDGKFGILNLRFLANNMIYTSAMAHATDIQTVSEFNYHMTGVGIGGCYHLVKKSKLTISHGYSVDFINIKSASLNLIQKDLILNTSDTVNNINVMSYQNTKNRISISAIFRADYKLQLVKGMSIFATWSIAKALKDSQPGLDILTYFGGMTQSTQIGVKYEII